MYSAQEIKNAVKSVTKGFRPSTDSISLDVSDATDVDVLLTYALTARSLDEASAAVERVLELDPENEVANAGFTWFLGVRDSAERLDESSNEDESEEEAPTAETVEASEGSSEQESFSCEFFGKAEKATDDAMSEDTSGSNSGFSAALPFAFQQVAETSNEQDDASSAEAEQEEKERAEAVKEEQEAEAVVAEAEELADEVHEAAIAPGSTPVVEPAKAGDKLTILTVDDSPTIRKLLAMTLEREGFNVVQAQDGVEALVKMSECNPAMILSDINMPRLDGYKLCKFVKKHAKTKHIPVIMLSGKDGVFDKLRGRMSGCDGYLTKPFESKDLLEKIRSFIGTTA